MRAAVDVGTNTVRMLIGRVEEGRILPSGYHREITRLGGGLTAEKGLAPESMERTLFALKRFAAILRQQGVTEVNAVGTAALREACNGEDFSRKVREESGIPLRVIEGEEEASLSVAGVMAALDPRPPLCYIFDIGGGSTEVSVVEEDRVLFHRSYPVGVVRLAENHPGYNALLSAVSQNLAIIERDIAGNGLSGLLRDDRCMAVGTAGTVTTLAALHLGMTRYDWRRVNNLRLPATELQSWLNRLKVLSIPERESLPGMEKGRADLIVPGILLVQGLLSLGGKATLTVSDFGLLEGVLLAP